MEKYHSKAKEWASFSQTGNHSRSGDRSQKHTQSLSKSQLPKEVVFHRERQKKQTHHLQDLVMSPKCLITSICSFKVLQNTTYLCVCVCVLHSRFLNTSDVQIFTLARLDAVLFTTWELIFSCGLFTQLHTFHYL